MLQSSSLAKCVAIGLAACAITPAAAGAVPADLHTAGPAKSVHHATPANLTAPDQVDRVSPAPSTNVAPVWPNGPQPRVVSPTAAPKATAPSDGGSDVGLILGLSGGALLLAGGLGLAGRKHVRQGQPA